MLKRLFTNTVYVVKVYPNRIDLRSLERSKSLTLSSAEGVTTKRLLVGQFTVADQLMRKGMKQLNESMLFPVKPVVIIQPMSMYDDGLSQVEERVLHELAAGAGARKVKVWVGHKLSDREALEKIKNV